MRQKIMVSIWYFIAYFVVNSLIIISVLRSGYNDFMGADAIGLFVALLMILAYHKRQKDNIFNKKNITWRNFIFTLGIGITGQVITSSIIVMLPKVAIKNQENLEQIIGMSSIVTTFIAVVILGPIVEELIFRHLIINILFKHKQWIGIIVSAILFALMHSASSVTEYVIYGLPGLVLGYINVKLGLENAMIWHITMNGMAFLVMVGVG